MGIMSKVKDGDGDEGLYEENYIDRRHKTL